MGNSNSSCNLQPRTSSSINAVPHRMEEASSSSPEPLASPVACRKTTPKNSSTSNPNTNSKSSSTSNPNTNSKSSSTRNSTTSSKSSSTSNSTGNSKSSSTSNPTTNSRRNSKSSKPTSHSAHTEAAAPRVSIDGTCTATSAEFDVAVSSPSETSKLDPVKTKGSKSTLTGDGPCAAENVGSPGGTNRVKKGGQRSSSDRAPQPPSSPLFPSPHFFSKSSTCPPARGSDDSPKRLPRSSTTNTALPPPGGKWGGSPLCQVGEGGDCAALTLPPISTITPSRKCSKQSKQMKLSLPGNPLKPARSLPSKAKPSSFPEFRLAQSLDPIGFSADELEAATAGYEQMIGEGGFGSVFKGFLRDRDTGKVVPVAVKVLKSEDVIVNKQELMKEVVALAKLQHPHILRLLGFCMDGVCAMVYDYMPGGDVSKLLKKCREGEAEFPWKARLRVARSCALALAAMHEMRMVHRDFKGSNVLLDEDLSPRVADFGLVKPIENLEASHVSTGIKGSIGYLDPLYFALGHVHTKSDVYSFGVFLVELITGKSAHCDRIHETITPELTKGRIGNGLVREIVDPNVGQGDVVVLRQAKALAELARHCLMETWESRPTMGHVAEAVQRVQLFTRSVNGTKQSVNWTKQSETGTKQSETGTKQNAVVGERPTNS